MKTAMQEMIEYLESKDRKFTYTYLKAIELLEKEKKQMFEFADKYVDFIMGGTEYSAEEYYNETYQNK